MILSDLFGCAVVDAAGARLGTVIDARFAIDGAPHQLLADARLVGLIVSPRSRASTWGYERVGVRSPWPIAQFIHRRHRGMFLVGWADLARIDSGRITLRDGYERRDASLPGHSRPAQGS